MSQKKRRSRTEKKNTVSENSQPQFNPGWKILNSLAYAGASMVFSKFITGFWEKRFNRKTPVGTDAVYAPGWQVAIYGALTGVVFALLERAVMKLFGSWSDGE